MEYRIVRDSSELYHHGIKGQKWGVRRYQNADGSLTWLGRRRYNRDADFKKSVDRNRALQKAREKAKATREAKKKEAEDKIQLLKSSDPELLYKNRHLLTTEEINERMNRIDVENKLKSKIPEKENKIDSVTKKINKAACLFSEVDKAYSTLTSSSIASSVGKLLGIETKSNKNNGFYVNDFIKNIHNKSNQEVKDAADRVNNMKTIYNFYNSGSKPNDSNDQNNNNSGSKPNDSNNQNNNNSGSKTNDSNNQNNNNSGNKPNNDNTAHTNDGNNKNNKNNKELQNGLHNN